MIRRRVALVPLTALALAACGGGSTDTGGDDSPGERLEVVVGAYPYEFVAQRVGGDAVRVENLTEPGAEPHEVDFPARQVAMVGEADLVVQFLGFQPALDEAVAQSGTERALDVLSTVPTRTGPDPHVWLDPKRLATVADAVAERLAEQAPDQADGFRSRAEALRADLEALDGELRTGLASCERRELVTSHDAFGYLAQEYGLEQVPLTGLSPEAEPSPRRLAEVTRFARANGVTTIFFEETVSPRVAEQLAREVGAAAEVLSPLESAPDSGDYLSAMRANLQALRTALDCA